MRLCNFSGSLPCAPSFAKKIATSSFSIVSVDLFVAVNFALHKTMCMDHEMQEIDRPDARLPRGRLGAMQCKRLERIFGS